jgi:hypothetical protein
MIHGFDISAYQSTAAPAADFVIVKATEGKSYTSSKFAAQWASAKTRARHRGAYHFARPEESSAKDQAARFLDTVEPQHGESVWLDLEASKLSQSETNTWARKFGDELRSRSPGVTGGAYFGSGYASNGTGRDLNQHYEFWWYPEYPSSYQLTAGTDIEELRAANRSARVHGRFPIAAMTSKWPPAVSPWLPSGLTCGWREPHIWQFTDNYGGLDANVTALTIEQLAGGGQPTPQEEDVISGSISAGKGAKPGIELAAGGPFKTIKLGCDNTRENTDLGITRQPPASIRLAMHVPGRTGKAVTVTVGAALTDTKGWADSVKEALPSGCDRIDVERNDDGARPVTFSVY